LRLGFVKEACLGKRYSCEHTIEISAG
jgi:hypothetical protein